MEFTVDSKLIANAVNIAAAAAETKSTIPILQNALVEAGSEGDIVVTCTNLEVAVRVRVPGAVKTPGKATLDAKRLSSYISSLPSTDLVVKEGKSNWLTLTCGRSRMRAAGLGTESFPDLPSAQAEPLWIIKVAAAELKRALELVNISISSEESRFTMNGCLIDLNEGKLTVVSTDGHRLMHTELAVRSQEAGGPAKALLPRLAIKHIANACKTPDQEATVVLDNHHFHITVGDVKIVCRRLTGNFPDWQRVLPKANSRALTVSVPTEATGAAIKRLMPFSDERSHSMRFTFTPECLTLFSQMADTGDCEESIPATFSGAGELTLACNGRYIQEYLSQVKQETVELRMADEKSALDFISEDSRYVVMPMRL